MLIANTPAPLDFQVVVPVNELVIDPFNEAPLIVSQIIGAPAVITGTGVIEIFIESDFESHIPEFVEVAYNVTLPFFESA